jgi:hypothetical protein
MALTAGKRKKWNARKASTRKEKWHQQAARTAHSQLPPADIRDSRGVPQLTQDFPPEYSRRDRDRAFEDQYAPGSSGQSYRPGGSTARERSPPPPRPGDSYRGAARSPPPVRAARSPPRRDYADTYRAPPPMSASRGRSRSPIRRDECRDDYRRARSPTPRGYRDRDIRDSRDVRDVRGGGGDSYRGRPRRDELDRREELPRDDLFRREPEAPRYRDEREYRDDRAYRDERAYRVDDRGYGSAAGVGRSPAPRYRDRSPAPLLKRAREPSPVNSRGRRTPPPPKRERLASPPRGGRYDDYAPPSRGVSPPPARRRYSPDPRDRRAASPMRDTRDYRPRSPSPRGDRVDPRDIGDWRYRQRSPPPSERGYGRRDYEDRMEDVLASAGLDSGVTSRRSSPPVHPSRLQVLEDRTRRDGYDGGREPYRAGARDNVAMDSRRSVASPLPRDRGYADDRDRGYPNSDDRIPPSSSQQYRDPYRNSVDDNIPPPRAPPSGPAAQRGVMVPPTGPSAAAPVLARPGLAAGAAVVPPSGPRSSLGGAPPSAPRGGRGGFGGGRGGGFAARGGRGGFGAGPGFGRGAGAGAPGGDGFDGGAGAVPPSGPRGSFSSQQQAPAFRPNNTSSATTYPRSQRFAPNGQPIPDAPAGPSASASTPTGPGNGGAVATPPTGPKAFLSQRRTSGMPFNNPNNASSGTTEHVTVFNTNSNNSSASPSKPTAAHPALADLPALAPPGGFSKGEPSSTAKLSKLELEAEKLRREIEGREAKKRKSLRDWEKSMREVENASLKGSLAAGSLAAISGEGMGLGTEVGGGEGSWF